jgi:hypothetical protein
LQELVGDKALQRFRVEYEKLFRTLKKSHGAPHVLSFCLATSRSKSCLDLSTLKIQKVAHDSEPSRTYVHGFCATCQPEWRPNKAIKALKKAIVWNQQYFRNNTSDRIEWDHIWHFFLSLVASCNLPPSAWSVHVAFQS